MFRTMLCCLQASDRWMHKVGQSTISSASQRLSTSYFFEGPLRMFSNPMSIKSPVSSYETGKPTNLGYGTLRRLSFFPYFSSACADHEDTLSLFLYICIVPLSVSSRLFLFETDQDIDARAIVCAMPHVCSSSMSALSAPPISFLIPPDHTISWQPQ